MTENIRRMFSRWCDGYGYNEDSDEDLSLYRGVEEELSILNTLEPKPLEWKLVLGCNSTWYADSIIGQWVTWEIGRGYYMPPGKVGGIPVEGDLKAAQDMAFQVYKNLLLSQFTA